MSTWGGLKAAVRRRTANLSQYHIRWQPCTLIWLPESLPLPQPRPTARWQREQRDENKASVANKAASNANTAATAKKRPSPQFIALFLDLFSVFIIYRPATPPAKGTRMCLCDEVGGLKKENEATRSAPFFFLRKTRNEALCTSAAVAYLKGLARLLLCHQHKGDWGKTQTEPLCRCGSGY